jgi:hypothetical protein
MFVMNDDVRDRSTWTSQDSLGASFGEYSDGVPTISVGDVARPDVNGMAMTRSTDLMTWKSGNPAAGGYIEAQIHGRTDIHDVKGVYVNATNNQIRGWALDARDGNDPWPKANNAAIEALRASGVPWFTRGEAFVGDNPKWVKGK